MTKPPCKTPDGIDCTSRYIGCRAECKEWHDWLAIHEAEKEQIRKNRSAERDVEIFEIEKPAREKRHNCMMRNRERRKK